MKVNFEQTDVVKVMAFLDNGVLAHIVNDIGVMGAGIAKAIAEEWPLVEQEYFNITANIPTWDLGSKVLFVPINKRLTVANLFAQKGIKSKDNKVPIQYDWLQTCLDKLFEYAIEEKKDIRIPRIGSGLARGNWDKIWYMIIESAWRLNYEGTLTLHQL